MMRSCKAQPGRHGAPRRIQHSPKSLPHADSSVALETVVPHSCSMGHPQTSPVSLAHGGQVSTTWRDQALVSGRQGGRGRGSPHHLDTHADGGKTDPLKTQTGLQVQPGQQQSKRVRVHETAHCRRLAVPLPFRENALLFSAGLGKGPHCPTCGVLVPRAGTDPRPSAVTDPKGGATREAPRLLSKSSTKRLASYSFVFFKQHIKA